MREYFLAKGGVWRREKGELLALSSRNRWQSHVNWCTNKRKNTRLVFPFIRYAISDLLTGLSTYQSCNFPHCFKPEFPLFSWPSWHMWTVVNLYFLFKSDSSSSYQHAIVHHACVLQFVFAEGNRNQSWLLKLLHLICNQFQRKWANDSSCEGLLRCFSSINSPPVYLHSPFIQLFISPQGQMEKELNLIMKCFISLDLKIISGP